MLNASLTSYPDPSFGSPQHLTLHFRGIRKINSNMRTYYSRLLLPALVLLKGAHAQIQILNVTTNEFPLLTSTCLAVLNQVVACDQAVTWAGRGRFEDDATLTALCTTACTTALTTWHRRVTGACTTRFNDGAGFMLLPQIWSKQYLEEYDLVCLQHK